MVQRRTIWYQREPYPAIVGVLLDHGLLHEGGTGSLQFASRILANEEDPAWRGDPVGAVAAQIVVERPWSSMAATRDAAQGIVDVLVDWRAGATS